jgi:hypothetical protein
MRSNMSESNKVELVVRVLDPEVAKKLVAVFSQEEFDAEVSLEKISDNDHLVFIKGEPRLFNKIREIANKYAIWMRVDGVDADDQSPWEAVFPELCSYTVCCPDEESAQKLGSELQKLAELELPKLSYMNIWEIDEDAVYVEEQPYLLDEIRKLSVKLSMEVEVEGYPLALDYDDARDAGLFFEYNYPADPSLEELKAKWIKS